MRSEQVKFKILGFLVRRFLGRRRWRVQKLVGRVQRESKAYVHYS